MIVSDSRTIPEIVLSTNVAPPHPLFPLFTSDNMVKQRYKRTIDRDEYSLVVIKQVNRGEGDCCCHRHEKYVAPIQLRSRVGGIGGELDSLEGRCELWYQTKPQQSWPYHISFGFCGRVLVVETCDHYAKIRPVFTKRSRYLLYRF